MSEPLVSIIIASKNTADYFEQCLESVKNQTYKNIELVIVDNFSTDDTFKIAKRHTNKAFQIGPERSTQFNFGFKQSSGELIYRIGPDYVLEPNVVEECVKKIDEGYDALALHNRSVGESIWAKVRYVERESYRNNDSIVAVRFMKREVFENLGMLDESLVAGEDFDLHNRLVKAGYKWIHVDAIENHIGEPKNIYDVWRKFYYYGRTICRYRQKNKEAAKQQFVFFRPSFKKIEEELYKSKRLLIAFYIYLLVKYTAGAVGYLYGPPSNLPKMKDVELDRNLTSLYLNRTVDSRMVSIIERCFSTGSYKSILDLGCGSGLYGKFLKQNGASVIGFDYDAILCDESRKTGNYSLIICSDAVVLDDKVESVDAIFCSEVLEHISNEKIGIVISKMEKVAKIKIVITVPNPLSPHFKYDSSHILNYSIYSFLATLNKSKKFRYTMYPIGFSERNLEKWYFRFLNLFSSRICLFSPTVLYVGSTV